MRPKVKFSRWQKKSKLQKKERYQALFNWRWIIDYLMAPGFIFWCVFEPNFTHGFIDHLEAGQYLSVINEIFRGKIPIKDAFILFGPLHVYIIALIMLFFGKTLAVLRAYFHFGTILSLIVAYCLGRQVCRSRFFSYLFAFLLVVEVNHPFWSTRWGGIRLGLGLLVLLFLINFVKKKKAIWLFWAGFFSAAAMLCSVDIGIFSFVCGILVMSLVCFIKKDKYTPGAFKCFLFYAGGAFLILAPFFIYFLTHGALFEYLKNIFIIIPRDHVRTWKQAAPSFLPQELDVVNFFNWVFSVNFKLYLPVFIFSAAVIYIGVKLIKNSLTDKVVITSMLTVYGLLSYISSFRAILGPQFQGVLPSLFILVCFFLEYCFAYVRKYFFFSDIERNLRKNIYACALIATMIFSFIYLLGSEKRYYGSLQGWLFCQANKDIIMPMYSMPILKARFTLEPIGIERARGIITLREQKEEMEGAVNYIIENTKKDEPFFTFPEHGIYNFFCDRPAVGRFPIAGFAMMNNEYRGELLDSLKRIRPRYVLAGRRLSNLAMSIGRQEEILPEISSYIKENYTPVAAFNGVEIYRLK